MIDLIIAILIDFIIGDPYGFPHPVIYIGKLISFLEKKFRKIFYEDKIHLKLSGLFIVIIVLSISFFVPFIILKVAKTNFYVYHLLNIFILWTTIAANCLHKESYKVYNSLNKNDIKDARVKLSYIVGRDTSNLDENEIVRATVETVAENTSDGIIAPIFYALIGGAPFAMLYKGVNTMDSMLGYLNEKYKHIGYFPAKIDDIFNFLPARITGILICIMSPLVHGNIINSLKIMFRDRKNHKSPNCAYPEGAVAGALKIQLGGTNIYFGQKVYKPTIGDKILNINRYHIVDTIKLMYASEILLIVLWLIIKFLHITQFKS